MARELKGLDGQTIQRGGQDVLASVQTGIIKSVDLKTRILIMKGTNEQVDRDGDIVRTNGIVLDNFLKNPVFLWAHDYKSVPLAAAFKVIKRRSPEPYMEFHLRYPTEGLNPFADMILGLYHEGIINASSIGFIPLEARPRQLNEGEDDKRYWNPKEFVKSELLELSGCAVPCNPGAVQNALKGKAFDGMDMKGAIMALEQGLPMPEILHRDDIMMELAVKTVLFEDETTPTMVQVPEQLESKEQDDDGVVPVEKGGCPVGEEEKVEEKSVEALDLKLESVLEKVIGIGTQLDSLTSLVRGLVEAENPKDDETGEEEEGKVYETVLAPDSSVKETPAAKTQPQTLEEALKPFTKELAEIGKNLKDLLKR